MDYEEFKEEVVKRLSKFAGETNVQLMGNRLNLMLWIVNTFSDKFF